MSFKARKTDKDFFVASVTIENNYDSIVADATQTIDLIDRALKDTAKFSLSLRD